MFFRLAKYLLVLALSMFVAQASYAKDYKEGSDFKIVSDTKTQTAEIREFFSYYCTHCNSLSPTFKKIKEKFKGEAKFVYNPVGMIGGEMGVESQKGFAVALKLGLEDEYSAALFEKVHVKEEIPEGHDYFVDIFESIGVPKDKVESDFNSFVTLGQIAQFDKLVGQYKITAVPEIVVNGKYLVITDNLDSVEDYEELIAYLLTLP